MKRIILCFIVINSLLSAQMPTSAKSKLKSLILPGMGEFSMGHKTSARSFFIREAAIWLICIGGKQVSNWHTTDYQAFAHLHAGVDMDEKNYLFAVHLGHYNSMAEYNETKARQRQVDDIYSEGEGNEWKWDNTENRIHFDKIRIKSVTYDKYANFAIGGLVLHRMISLINVIYLERRFPDISLTPRLSTNAGDLQFKLQLDL